MVLADYSPSTPSYLSTKHRNLVNFSKCIPRSTTSIGKRQTPDWYPIEDVKKGFGVLGHIKRVRTPNIEKMMPRNKRPHMNLNLFVKQITHDHGSLNASSTNISKRITFQ